MELANGFHELTDAVEQRRRFGLDLERRAAAGRPTPPMDEPFLAAQTYRNLLVFWPQTGAFWVGLGGALEGQHLEKEAVECYQRALKTETLREDLLAYAQKRLRTLN